MPRTIGEPAAESVATIELRVNYPQQLFNSLDPSPFYERDLDQDAEEYIVDSADEYPLNRPLRLAIYCLRTRWILSSISGRPCTTTSRIEPRRPGAG